MGVLSDIDTAGGQAPLCALPRPLFTGNDLAAAALSGQPEPLREHTLAGSEKFVGDSMCASQVRALIGRVARTQITALIHGETGTGKEIVAMLLHRNSPRAAMPLVPVNCAAIPETMVEGELFGYEKGAFSG